MPAKMPSLNGTAPANPPATATPAARPAPTPAAAPPPAATPRPPTPTAPPANRGTSSSRDDEGVQRQADDRTTPYEGAGAYPKYDTFAPLTSGRYTFLCSVNKIVKWPFGTVITFRVEFGDERGRQVDWNQSPPASFADKPEASRVWRSDFFGAYAAGGWGIDPDPATKWPGWQKNRAGVNVPPYDVFFVHTANDGVQVPVLILVTLDVDRPPYDRFPKVKRVEHYVPEGATTPIQAPMPYHIPAWLANDRGWSGTFETITSKVGVIEVIKTDYKQIPFGHGGLKTMRDLKG